MATPSKTHPWRRDFSKVATAKKAARNKQARADYAEYPELGRTRSVVAYRKRRGLPTAAPVATHQSHKIPTPERPSFL